jgi:hypothetical protein
MIKARRDAVIWLVGTILSGCVGSGLLAHTNLWASGACCGFAAGLMALLIVITT